jgi:eukaryotic-like serine/threonine-protein kinase
VVVLIDAGSKAVIGQQQPGIALLASTLIIGGLYDPTHRQVRHFIDRRLYGLKVDLDKMEFKPRKMAPKNDAPVTMPPNWGAYEVKSLLGRGGMGNVYRGRHTTLNREVAIKMLPPGLADDQQTRTRFEQEANIVAGLRHPNIVQVFDFGELNGTNYMVMEYIDGLELSKYIKQNAPLPLNHIRSIVNDVASALDHAHQQGFVHRDIKPSNVMLQTPTNVRGSNEFPYRAILMDFGIARILGSNSTLTNTSMIGTLEYSSPEQILTAREVTPRADIYALGVMTYQMLTGKLPFEGSNPGVLVFAHLQKPAPDPRAVVPTLPIYVVRAVLRALEKDPEARFASAGEFAAALNPPA